MKNSSAGKDLNESYLDGHGLISRWMLSYLDPLLKIGSQRPLVEGDLGTIGEKSEADDIFTRVKHAWEEEKRKVAEVNKRRLEKAKARAKPGEEEINIKYARKTPHLALIMLKVFGVRAIIRCMTYYLLSAVVQFIPVLVLNDLVRYFEEGGENVELMFGMNPWVEVVLIFVAPLLTTLLQTQHSLTLTECGIFTRTACATLLYDKSLVISASGRASTNVGQVVNMMSNDTNQLQRFIQFSGFVVVAPIQIIACLVLIFRQVGNATWVGVAYMVGLAPINLIMFAALAKMRKKVLKYSDIRVKLMNEILNGIRIIKVYAWERPFRKEVAKVRREELKALTKVSYISAVGFSVLLMSTPVITPILVFLTYVRIQDDQISASVAFTTIALFNLMRFPFAFLPMGILQYIQAKISIVRISRYLELPELKSTVVAEGPPEAKDHSPETKVGSITIRNSSFAWTDPNMQIPSPADKKSRKRGKKTNDDNTDPESVSIEEAKKGPVLEDISCTIEAGKLIVITGSVGSGKSSLLSALLGEMEPIDNSKVFMPQSSKKSGFISYCNQTPWVVNDTLKGNILFGRKFNEERYNKVVHVCALKDDFAILPAGDLTEIGERGINLSGGQKARVCLARAIYSPETKIILMDDPLSAVDSHVGDHIFNEAIVGEISHGVTRVLVTHHVHFLPQCDHVIVMEEGKIKHQGRYEDLIAQGVEFKGAIEASNEDDDVEGGESEIEVSYSSAKEKLSRSSSISEKDKKNDLKKKGTNLISDEDRALGSVDSSAYFRYAKAGGLCNVFLVFMCQALNRAFEVGATFWLAYWASETVMALQLEDPLTDRKTKQYVGIYGLLGLGSVIGLGIRGVALAQHRLYASRKLHNDLTDSILRAPISFFDVTPIGRILNRFAYDTDKIDLEVMNSISQALSVFFSVFGALSAMLASTKGLFVVPLIPMVVMYYYIQKWFRKTSTELQRITNILGSPIFSDFSQVLSGTSTVRAYGMGERFFNNCKSSFNANNTAYVLVQFVSLWLGLRLDIIGGFIGAFIAGLSVGTAKYDFIPAAWLGLGLSFAIEVTGFLKHGVRMIAQVEADLTSVERIYSYTCNVEQEAPDTVPERDPEDGTWPLKGDIKVDNMSMRYRDGPLVLKSISFDIKGGEKIGVVGRTGSGKSSLMIGLFRINELEQNGGKISIDGIDISEIGTHALRSNLSIIPQDPVLFSNTVRYNLDPFETVDDNVIWSALRNVELADFVADLPNGLLEQVAEGGENFSQGQRQLLCIARSIIRKPKILIMDEATASIDNSTDELIQQMVRVNFADATVLTIAHRLNTIMDSDRVLVLDNGHVAEFDSPKNLLSDSNSIFYGMVEKSRAKGSSSSLASLVRLAE